MGRTAQSDISCLITLGPHKYRSQQEKRTARDLPWVMKVRSLEKPGNPGHVATVSSFPEAEMPKGRLIAQMVGSGPSALGRSLPLT